MQKLYTELKDKGLDIVAVNAGDTELQVQKYIDDNDWTLKIAMGGSGEQYVVGKRYGVQVYPTNYLVGSDGKVLWRGVGFNEKALRDALAAAGVK